MSVTVTIKDETTTGEVYASISLELPTEEMTAQELIRERVYQEVQDYNRNAEQKVFQGLVQPTGAEQTLNGPQAGFTLKKHREVDWKEQFEAACDAFLTNRFLLLVDNRQAETLDERFTIRSSTEISFMKLTPLVGG